MKLDVARLLPRVLVVRAGIRLLPLPRLAGLMGIGLPTQQPGTDAPPEVRVIEPGDEQLWRAMRAACLIYPEGAPKGGCLARCLVLGWRFRALKPTLRIGIPRAGGKPRAHAWLEIDGRPLEYVGDFLPLEPSRTGYSGPHVSGQRSTGAPERRD